MKVSSQVSKSPIQVFRMRASSLSSSFSSSWPDPNSPILSKIGVGVPLVELFKWLDVRDTFFGENERKQDITAALALARDCKHPDAEWLTSIFEGKNVSTVEDARKVFLCCENDARALCSAWSLTEDRWKDLSSLFRASEMGNVFACSVLCFHVWEEKKEEAFRLAQLAASQHERDGFYWLGCCFRNGLGFKKDLNLAKENLFIAAELGHVWAAAEFGDMLGEFDPFRWLWWDRAALRGYSYSFFRSFSKQVRAFFSGSGNASVVFLIGRALKGNINMEKKQIFESTRKFDSLIVPANQALSFYDFQIKSALSAVDAWTIIGIRVGIFKDVRKLIGKIIWDARVEANYPVLIEPKNARRCFIQ